MPIITLTTDFGLQDSYVGAMKGVLLARCPHAQLVDITHQVPPQNVRIGALRLAAAAPYFPAGSVHLAVVDPGVGGPRRPLAVACGGQFFVGPDNGLLSLAAPRDREGWRAVELTSPEVRLPRVSSTFHGRDIFAPAAAYLAAGGDIGRLGPDLEAITELELGRPSREGQRLAGAVLDIDRFGNLVTNIRAEHLGQSAVREVRIGERQIKRLSTWYDPAHRLVALINSDGWLEVAAPGGSAAEALAAQIGEPVEVILDAG